MIRRREFLKASAIGTGIFAFGPAFWQRALAAPAVEGPGPYGPLQPADANGIMLPPGFKSREIARGGAVVPGTSYQWHIFPDGQATYRTEDGGFILVSNSENPPDVGAATPGTGGASAIRFNADGSIADAYRILGETSVNCAGGPTPWGTWLSCEEHDAGHVWECDPTGKNPAVEHRSMGTFSHEAVCVDPVGRHVYLTEDHAASGFYRFTPANYPNLAAGTLEVARVGADGTVEWLTVPDPSGASAPTREQVPGMTRFDRGEGIWFDSGTVYLCTTNDDKVHTYDTRTRKMDVLYDGSKFENPPLTNVDNITVARSGDVYVCEDTTNSDDPGLDIGLITPDRRISRFLKVTGSTHTGAGEARSELCGVVFDPSGERLFFSSQRGFVSGVVYEITGPFRPQRQARPGTFRVHVPPRATIGTTLRHGLPITVVTSAPVHVAAKMTADLPSRPGRRRNTLARVTEDVAAGREKVRLRPRGRRTRARMRRERSFRARVTIVVTDASGAKRTYDRTVRLAHRFRRRRRRKR